MPKLYGFVLVVVASGMLMGTLHDAMRFFVTHGASSAELWMVLATAAAAGGLVVGVAWNLWG